jgi:hypothetical protein
MISPPDSRAIALGARLGSISGTGTEANAAGPLTARMKKAREKIRINLSIQAPFLTICLRKDHPELKLTDQLPDNRLSSKSDEDIKKKMSCYSRDDIISRHDNQALGHPSA